jgi:hypothetical protein
MQTKLSKEIVFNYIKNFCYSPIYSVVEVQITSADVPTVPFQFDSSTYYTVGAYIVKDNQLYITLDNGSGPWAAVSDSNTFTGEAYAGERMLANVDNGTYDSKRFAPVIIEDALTVYEIVNDRTGNVVLAYDTYAHAVDYIRTYITWADYAIRVEQDGNKYTAYWDNHVMEFFEPE